MRSEVHCQLQDLRGREICHIQHLLQVTESETDTFCDCLGGITCKIDILLSDFKKKLDCSGSQVLDFIHKHKVNWCSSIEGASKFSQDMVDDVHKIEALDHLLPLFVALISGIDCNFFIFFKN